MSGNEPRTKEGKTLDASHASYLGYDEASRFRINAWRDDILAIEEAARDEGRREAVERIRSLHVQQEGLRRLHPVTRTVTDYICEECDRPWPCATVMALDEVAGLNASESGQPSEGGS